MVRGSWNHAAALFHWNADIAKRKLAGKDEIPGGFGERS